MTNSTNINRSHLVDEFILKFHNEYQYAKSLKELAGSPSPTFRDTVMKLRGYIELIEYTGATEAQSDYLADKLNELTA